MYSRPRFLEELHAIREEMSRECDYDMDLFAETIRKGTIVISTTDSVLKTPKKNLRPANKTKRAKEKP